MIILKLIVYLNKMNINSKMFKVKTILGLDYTYNIIITYMHY